MVFRRRFARVRIRSAGPSGRATKTSKNQVSVSDDTTLPPAPPPPDAPPPPPAAARHRADHHRRGDAPLLPRLRHERDRGARAARCARRPEAGAAPHPLRDEGRRLRLDAAVPQVRAHRRRRDGQVSPARRHGDLRRHGAHGAGLLHAPAADRRAGQFRLDGRRSAGGDALHRGAPGHASPRRCWPTSTRTRSISSRTTTRRDAGADGPAGGLPEPAGQRRGRHRRRHGDQHPAAQSRRADRRLLRADRQSRAHHRRS